MHSVVCGLNDVEELKIHGYIGPFLGFVSNFKLGCLAPLHMALSEK